jgi:hypothetical protein
MVLISSGDSLCIKDATKSPVEKQCWGVDVAAAIRLIIFSLIFSLKIPLWLVLTGVRVSKLTPTSRELDKMLRHSPFNRRSTIATYRTFNDKFFIQML